MANLIITNYCNAECPFCFAADSRHRMMRNGSREMDEIEFRDCLEFSMGGGNRELRLLGGEPTLHPLFKDFVKVGREAGCSVTVFSNGVMPAASCEALAVLDPEICNVVINMGANIREADKAVRRDTLQQLGPRVTLGYTITSAEFSFDGAIALIGAFGLRKNIRIGLAHPTWRGANKALPDLAGSQQGAASETLSCRRPETLGRILPYRPVRDQPGCGLRLCPLHVREFFRPAHCQRVPVYFEMLPGAGPLYRREDLALLCFVQPAGCGSGDLPGCGGCL